MTFDNALMFLRKLLNPLRKLLSEISDAVEAVAETTNAVTLSTDSRRETANPAFVAGPEKPRISLPERMSEVRRVESE